MNAIPPLRKFCRSWIVAGFNWVQIYDGYDHYMCQSNSIFITSRRCESGSFDSSEFRHPTDHHHREFRAPIREGLFLPQSRKAIGCRTSERSRPGIGCVLISHRCCARSTVGDWLVSRDDECPCGAQPMGGGYAISVNG